MFPFRWLATRDVMRDRERRARFIERFNEPGALEVGADVLVPLSTAAHDLVRAELTRSESAAFIETHVRRCADGITRSAGLVRFAGSDKQGSEMGFLVEFDPDTGARLVDLCDRDPVILKTLPPQTSWDGTTVPYGSPSTATAPRRDWFWPIFWVVTIGLLAFMGIAMFL